MEKSELVVVCDAGPIIHLDELNCLDVLNFSRILIPQVVWKGVLMYRNILLEHSERFEVISEVKIPSEIKEDCKFYDLHLGESAAISLTLQFKNSILLTDDSAARLYAKARNIQVHGTVGLLLRSIREEIRTAENVPSSIIS